MTFEEQKTLLEKILPVKTQEIFIILCLMKLAVYRTNLKSNSEVENKINSEFSKMCSTTLSSFLFMIMERTHGLLFMEDPDKFSELFCGCEYSTFLYTIEFIREELKQNNPNFLPVFDKYFENQLKDLKEVSPKSRSQSQDLDKLFDLSKKIKSDA